MSTATAKKIQAQGSSGTLYEFEVYPWGTPFRPIGGVYLILKIANGTSHVLYVGQTGDLSERFDNHHQKPCFDRNGKTHIAVLIEGTENRRLQIEQDLIRNYRPNCNDTI